MFGKILLHITISSALEDVMILIRFEQLPELGVNCSEDSVTPIYCLVVTSY